jgi:hypothetical protein
MYSPDLHRAGVMLADETVSRTMGRHRLVDQVHETAELLGRWRGVMSAITWPEATSSAAWRFVVPLLT